jgi:hypothetical protein
MVIDAGGGTVDISSYTFTKTSPIEVQELAIPGCPYLSSAIAVIYKALRCTGIFEGSVIVRQRAEDYFRG